MDNGLICVHTVVAIDAVPRVRHHKIHASKSISAQTVSVNSLLSLAILAETL